MNKHYTFHFSPTCYIHFNKSIKCFYYTNNKIFRHFCYVRSGVVKMCIAFLKSSRLIQKISKHFSKCKIWEKNFCCVYVSRFNLLSFIVSKILTLISTDRRTYRARLTPLLILIKI